MRPAARLAAFALLTFGSACSLLVDTNGLTGGAGNDAGDDVNVSVGDALADGADVISPEADAPFSQSSCPSSGDSSLVAWFPFDEPDDLAIYDCSGSALPASPIAGSTVKHVVGRIGRALDLDGQTCFDLGPASPLAFGANAFSVAAWIKPRVYSIALTDGGNPKPLWFVDRYAVSGSSIGQGWGVGTDDVSGVELKIFDTSGTFYETQANGTATDVWFHVAAVYTVTELDVYESGVLQSTTATSATPGEDPNAHGWLGCRGGFESFFDGQIDDLRVYSRALTQAEITTLAQ